MCGALRLIQIPRAEHLSKDNVLIDAAVVVIRWGATSVASMRFCSVINTSHPYKCNLQEEHDVTYEQEYDSWYSKYKQEVTCIAIFSFNQHK